MKTQPYEKFPILNRAIAGLLMDDPAANAEAETTLKRFAADLELSDAAGVIGSSWLRHGAEDEAAADLESDQKDGLPDPVEPEAELKQGHGASGLIAAAREGRIAYERYFFSSVYGVPIPCGRVIGVARERLSPGQALNGIQLMFVGDYFRPRSTPAEDRRDALRWGEWINATDDNSYDPNVSLNPVVALTEAAERIRFIRKQIEPQMFAVIEAAAAGDKLREIGTALGYRNGRADKAANALLRVAVEQVSECYRALDEGQAGTPTRH